MSFNLHNNFDWANSLMKSIDLLGSDHLHNVQCSKFKYLKSKQITFVRLSCVYNQSLCSLTFRENLWSFARKRVGSFWQLVPVEVMTGVFRIGTFLYWHLETYRFEAKNLDKSDSKEKRAKISFKFSNSPFLSITNPTNFPLKPEYFSGNRNMNPYRKEYFHFKDMSKIVLKYAHKKKSGNKSIKKLPQMSRINSK